MKALVLRLDEDDAKMLDELVAIEEKKAHELGQDTAFGIGANETLRRLIRREAKRKREKRT